MRFRNIFILLFLLVSVLPSFAQRGNSKNSLKVTVLDTLYNEPIGYATVYISKDGTINGAKFSTTDAEGKAVIDGLAAGKFIFTAEMMGYVSKKLNIEIKPGVNDLGKIYMTEDVSTIEQVVISAVGNPIVVKKDTIEYSAASFKTTENDVLEDLLKKLPGIEVDAS